MRSTDRQSDPRVDPWTGSHTDPAPSRRPAGAPPGQATVEAALVIPVVVLLALAVVQVALVARTQVLVTHAAREAVRAAAVDDDPGAPRAAGRAAGGLDPDRVSVGVRGREGPGSRVEVTVQYRMATDVPLVGSLLPDLDLRAVATMRVE